MAKKEEKINLGRVVLFRNYTAQKAEDLHTGDKDVCEILEVEDDQGEYIRAGYYVLPKADATVLSNEDGLVYVYNVSLPYLEEVAHLAKVEENIIIGQAFLYPGRNMPRTGPNAFQWCMFAGIFLLGAFAIFAG
ncbi:hypothetical protein [Paenibacillus sp. FSL H7-0714]|uniref:hypothetical protein n=1 Tax=Paenibacillus sp. FSL H7-0714 TaxID=2954735 RepID=UPI0030F86C83